MAAAKDQPTLVEVLLMVVSRSWAAVAVAVEHLPYGSMVVLFQLL